MSRNKYSTVIVIPKSDIGALLNERFDEVRDLARKNLSEMLERAGRNLGPDAHVEMAVYLDNLTVEGDDGEHHPDLDHVALRAWTYVEI